ncbi:MAG: histidinol phosphate phosphatase domain-containing protein [Candidatus Bathyarchaeia archaeon]
MNLGKRIELHTHSLLSDGELTPSEMLRRAEALGYEAIAITDHVDASNLESVVKSIVRLSEEVRNSTETELIPGVELTHVHPKDIDRLAKDARKLGATLIIVHGETPIEPVGSGTNFSAVSSTEVDILAHPGFITVKEGELARENGIYLELSSRRGHCLTNGHVAQVALETSTRLLVNTDLHSPGDFITQEMAYRVARGAGLRDDEALKVVRDNPQQLLKKIRV